jgi:hypothetical protein
MLTLLATSSTPTEKAITNWNTAAEIQNRVQIVALGFCIREKKNKSKRIINAGVIFFESTPGPLS